MESLFVKNVIKKVGIILEIITKMTTLNLVTEADFSMYAKHRAFITETEDVFLESQRKYVNSNRYLITRK